MKTRSAIVISTALIASISTAAVGVPVAAAEQAPWKQTFTVTYWPTTMTGQVSLAGPNGTLTASGNAISQPFLIFDYRVVSPLLVGLHLYYSPLMGASGFSNTPVGNNPVTGNAGLWGAEATYDWVIPLKPPAVLILNPYLGYGQQNWNQSTAGLVGNTINLSEVTGGLYVGLNGILPLSRQWFVSAGLSWYPSGFGSVNLSDPAHGLSSTGVATTPQLQESVAVTYSTSGWNFTLGYQWAQAWIGSINVPITTGGGQTLGGAVCPCNFQLNGVLLGVGKTF